MAITANSYEYSVFGNKSAVLADLAIDGSYSEGGLSIDPGKLFGLHSIDTAIIESANGCCFKYDIANNKIQVFGQAPPIVYEEHQIANASTGAIELKYPAAFIMNVTVPGQNLALRSTGVALASLGSNQCALSEAMADGEKTTLIANSNTDELAGDGAFTGGTTNWTFAAGSWTYGTNNLEKDANGTDTLTHDNFAGVVGKTYKLKYTLSEQGANENVIGSVTPTLGGVAGTARTAAGTYSENIKATTTGPLIFTPTNASRFVIDAITVSVQDVYVTYITQAWKEVWDNVVQDETLTLATGNNTLDSGNKILACMYVDQTTATAAALTMVDEDDTTASGEIRVMFNAATAQLNCHSAQNTKAISMTYIKNPGSGFLFDRAFNNETATKDGADPYTLRFANPVLIWGYSGQMPVNGGTTQVMIDKATTPAAGEFTIDFFSGPTRGIPTTPTGAGASHNHTFTGTSPVSSLDLATPAFSGTGLTAAGQVMTTTSVHTMTENQCAGMWLIPATQATPPMLILSNTAVSGAAAVLTVQGAAATDAGAYKIVKSLTPVGTNTAEATHTHAITPISAKGTIMDVKSNVTGTGAGVWGRASEIPTVPLELTEGNISLASIKAFLIGT